jgi:hypothetical protein
MFRRRNAIFRGSIKIRNTSRTPQTKHRSPSHSHGQNFENDSEGDRYLVWRVRLVPEDSIPMPKHVGVDTCNELYLVFKLYNQVFMH